MHFKFNSNFYTYTWPLSRRIFNPGGDTPESKTYSFHRQISEPLHAKREKQVDMTALVPVVAALVASIDQQTWQRSMAVSGHGYQGVLATSELILTQNKPLEKAGSQTEYDLPRQTFEGCNDYDQVNRCPLCTSNMAKGRTFVPSKEKEGNWVSLSTFNDQQSLKCHSSESSWEVH